MASPATRSALSELPIKLRNVIYPMAVCDGQSSIRVDPWGMTEPALLTTSKSVRFHPLQEAPGAGFVTALLTVGCR